jgi:hypothetical protein
VFWLDRTVIRESFKAILEGCDEARRRRVKEVIDEGWDLFARVMSDGSVLVTAVAVSFPFQLVRDTVIYGAHRTSMADPRVF